MKVLVTGGAGFIGGVTVRDLLDAGFDIDVLDNLECGHKSTIPDKCRLIKADLRSYPDIFDALSASKYDAVLHFAAYTIVPESVENPEKYFRNNVEASINLLNAMKNTGVKNIIFSSSAAVYGEPKDIPIKEDAPTAPANTYGQTKLTVEEYLRWYDLAYGIKSVSLRYFNAAGADLVNDLGEDRETETHLIPLVLHSASGRNKDVKIFGTDYPTKDGTCVRDYIHVKDLSCAHVLALKKLLETGKTSVYNLGSENGFTVKEIVKAAEKICGKKISVIETGRRAGDPPALIASSKKIRSELGWQQKHSDVEKIISDTWKWMERHPHGY
ncbi:MAG: UDP-glucose 4-epimerase GalE [Candidatus Saganbacteria bacterium]|nr:UDP-glucose 4-epimerase GalE [Candidatus Saganbacteria bacterium]